MNRYVFPSRLRDADREARWRRRLRRRRVRDPSPDPVPVYTSADKREICDEYDELVSPDVQGVRRQLPPELALKICALVITGSEDTIASWLESRTAFQLAVRQGRYIEVGDSEEDTSEDEEMVG
jgi:hypothetical protein